MFELVAERLEDPLEIEPVHEAGRGEEDRLAAEIAPGFELAGLRCMRGHERLHRVGVPGVDHLRLRGIVVFEASFALIDLGHPDVGRIADLRSAVHRCLHRAGRRRIGIDGNGVFSAECVLQNLDHLGRNLVAVRTRAGSRPADRFAFRRVGRVDRREGEEDGERHHG